MPPQRHLTSPQPAPGSRPGPDLGTGQQPYGAGPAARRLRPPGWRDPRLLVGLLLVLGSVVAGAQVVRSASDTVPVYSARHALTPGDLLKPSDVVVEQVRLADSARYLPAAGGLPRGQIVLRLVGAGELLPAAALGGRDQVEVRPVSVPVDEQAPVGLERGTLVDVWVATRAADRSEAFGRPKLVATNAQVGGRTTQRSALGGSGAASVQLLLTADLVPQVIEAVDNGARITLVPMSTSAGDGS